jgi:type IV pilus assembly protein PilV
MIEVLVSIVVLSFGLLGMVGMQAAALHANREARLQSSGIVLARELADMIRGNKQIGIEISASDNPYLGSFTTPLAAGTPTYCLSVDSSTACSAINATAPTACITAVKKPCVEACKSVAACAAACVTTATATCNTMNVIASAEMTEWLARVDAELPGARVVSCFDTAPFDTTTGLPTWTCTPGAGAVIVIKIGWTKGSTDKSATGAAALDRATGDGSAPSVVLQVTAGI